MYQEWKNKNINSLSERQSLWRFEVRNKKREHAGVELAEPPVYEIYGEKL